MTKFAGNLLGTTLKAVPGVISQCRVPAYTPEILQKADYENLDNCYAAAACVSWANKAQGQMLEREVLMIAEL